MILGITPARAGSKGLKDKNIRIVAGKPLIAWTIERALESKLLDEYFVCTESLKIAKIAKDYGAKVFMRPKSLAIDTSLIIDTLQYILENKPFKTIVLLQCTSPIRNKDLIDNCIRRYLNSDAETLATGFISKLTPYNITSKRRQDIEPKFYGDGNIDIISSKLISKGRLFSNNCIKMITTREENIEIDDKYDLWIAEKILGKRK